MKSINVLFVTTSCEQMGDSNYRTGTWLEEIAAPYYIFKEAGFTLTVASPNSGPVPLDPKSESIIMATQRTKRFLKDEEAMNFLSHSIPLEEIKTDDFDAVLLPGGHGCMWDIAGNKILKLLLEIFNTEDKPVAAIGHGVAGLLSLQDDKGEVWIKHKQITGPSNDEEKSAGTLTILPFLLETKLVSLEALYSKSANYVSHVVVDGNIITGQNPASSEDVAKKIVLLLKETKQKPLLQPAYDKQ